MVNPKKYILLLIICSLLICACFVISKTVSAREQNAESGIEALNQNPPESNEEPLETIVVTPEPSETPTPEPTEVPTPEPSPETTPDPTPEVTPIPAPVVTKHPSSETVAPGNSAFFIAKADGATSISWFIASPDGSKGLNAKDISSEFPYTSCTGTDGEMLGIIGIDQKMDGWKVICKFTGPGGDTFSEPAYLAVLGNSKQLRSLDEVLVLILNKKEAQTAGVSLANAANTAMIADYFTETNVSAEEVRSAVQKYTQGLSEDHRATYKEKASEIVEVFHWTQIDEASFKGSLETSGYEAKYYPWNYERIVSCFDALLID